MLIRWTYGEFPDKPSHPQSVEILEASILLAKRVWPEARRALCVNVIVQPWIGEQLKRIARETETEYVNAFGKLPPNLAVTKRNCWWKYAPFRLAPDDWELLLDNDCMIWREPPAITRWRRYGGMIGHGDYRGGETSLGSSARLEYGTYTQDLKRIDPSLNFCAGILGWGPDVREVYPPLEKAKTSPWYFCSEQGHMAMFFASWQGYKDLVGFDSVAYTNKLTVPPEEIIKARDGAHFAEHNIGRRTTWGRYYRSILWPFAKGEEA